jgi:hypothetical protein
MSTPRAHLTATPLGNGRILVVGGVDESTTELYDPPTGRSIPGGTLNEPHWGHLAVRLADGRVLVAGGGRYSAGAELYDPATNSWTPTGSMNVGRISFTGTLLRDGRVLVVGGLAADGTGVQASATLLGDGRVLVVGGGDAGDVYSPATGTWTATGPRAYPLVGGSAAALLPNGQVLSVGGARLANCTPKGCGSEPVASAELYTP